MEEQCPRFPLHFNLQPHGDSSLEPDPGNPPLPPNALSVAEVLGTR